MEQQILDDQRKQWQDSLLEMPEMFGSEASAPAYKAAAFEERELLKKLYAVTLRKIR